MAERPATNDPPRWGKINHGQTYGLIADDIARRLATLKMGDYEILLLNHIREYSWARSTRRKARDGGWPDAIPFDQTIPAVAKEMCGPIASDHDLRAVRKRLYEAVRTLVRDNILTEADGPMDALLINTNVGEWRTMCREILPSGGVWYALDANNCQAQTTPESTPTTVEDDPEISRQNGHVSRQNGHVSRQNGHVSRQNGHDTIEERARIRFKKTKEEKSECVLRTGAGACEAPEDASTIAATVSALIVEKSRDEDNAEFYQSEALRWTAAGHTLPEITSAILEAFARGASGLGLPRYVKRILDGNARRARADASTPPGASAAAGLTRYERNRARRKAELERAKAARAAAEGDSR